MGVKFHKKKQKAILKTGATTSLNPGIIKNAPGNPEAFQSTGLLD